MLTAQKKELLQRLRAGHFDPADTEELERTPCSELLAELEPDYPFRFQQRRIRDKWEVGMARSFGFKLAASFSENAVFPILLMLPVFRDCLLLSGEAQSVTGVAVATRLIVKPRRKPARALVLTTGRGFKLDRLPDGWAIKPVEKRTVTLTEEFLRKRGWQFDLFRYPLLSH